MSITNILSTTRECQTKVLRRYIKQLKNFVLIVYSLG